MPLGRTEPTPGEPGTMPDERSPAPRLPTCPLIRPRASAITA
jgi:hypothetical protein